MKNDLILCAVIAAILPALLAGCASKQAALNKAEADQAVPKAAAPKPAATPSAPEQIANMATQTTVPQASPTKAGSSSGAPASLNTEPLPIRLQYGEFDPLVSEPALPVGQRLAAYPEEEGYYIVQFDGPILDEWQKALDATGAERQGYVPEFAYLTRMSTAEKQVVAALPHIRWIGLYQPGYKIEPTLLLDSRARAILTVVTFPGVDMDAMKTEVSELGGVVLESSQNKQSGSLRIEIDLKQVVPLAQLPGVMWIEAWSAPTVR